MAHSGDDDSIEPTAEEIRHCTEVAREIRDKSHEEVVLILLRFWSEAKATAWEEALRGDPGKFS